MAGIQEYVVRRTRQAMEDLILAAERVPAEKREWHAMGESRTVLDLIQECAQVNARWAEILIEGEWMVWSEEVVRKHRAEMPTLESAIERLRIGTDLYLKAVEGIEPERLDESIELPWGVFSCGECLMHALWHMSYHEGQINYIQTLYGDWEG